MKRTYLLLIAALLGFAVANAVPANGKLVKVQQPDGTTISIRLVGDEYLHFNTTADGYSVVKNARGYYVYAQRAADGQLAPTQQVAHDEAARSAAELRFLNTVEKHLAPTMTEVAAQEKQAELKRQAKAREKRRDPQYDYTKFRGLLILVQFNDKEFSRPDYKDIISDMVSQENYTGYTDENGRQVKCPGSVRDYYSDNSMGLFQPEFDVYGPYTVDYSQYYVNGTNNANRLVNAAVNAADADIDFSQYDRDGDGIVDMIYFIFAGNGSNYSGNDSRLFWPHRSVIYNGQYYVQKDGVALWDYASSVELCGWTSQPSTITIEGIGTICHEFSHVLGLPDFYDADYSGSGGESNHPGEWSVMSGGSYFNNGRSPVGYSAFERYMVGFANPTLIEGEGSYTLENLSESNQFFRINTPVNKEFFILENRQQTGWDRYLPGHGMLIFRVDSTNARVWANNAVNNNPKHQYYELVRARGTLGSAGYDPFPGRGNVHSVNNVTTPANLLTWAGKETQWGLLNIKESNRVISFDVEDTYVLRELALPDSAVVGLGLSHKILCTATPDYAKYQLTWTSSNEDVATVDEEGYVTGLSVGKTTITVTSDNDLQATCEVEVRDLPVKESIAEFRTLAPGEESILKLNDAQVLYVYQNNIYLRDGSSSIVLSKTGLDAKRNNILNGSLYGRYTTLDDMPIFESVSGMTDTNDAVITEGSPAEPRVVRLHDLTEADYADYVTIDTLQLVKATGIWGVEEGADSVRLYNTFRIIGIKTPSTVEGKRFAASGIFGTHLVSGKLIRELYLFESPKELEWTEPEPDGIVLMEGESRQPAAVYDLQGRRISATAQLPKGIYIVNGRKIAIR